MGTFKFYTDSSLTTELTGNLISTQNMDGSTPPVKHTIYLGSVTASRKLRSSVNPGTDPIVIDVVDAAAGSGHPDTEVKLATTEAGLASATPGASLNLPAEILSGTANKATIWIEVDDTTGAIGVSTELSLVAVPNVREDPV